MCQSLTFSKAESDEELSYHGYTGEKIASSWAGDSLHGISLCFHPKNSSTCAPPPAGHSQVGVRIQSILQTDITPYSCQLSERNLA